MTDKFCVNCRHVRGNGSTASYRCAQGEDPDLVTGVPREVLCEIRRSAIGMCGREGRLFEPRDPEPERKPSGLFGGIRGRWGF